jgi:hypothetical protein
MADEGRLRPFQGAEDGADPGDEERLREQCRQATPEAEGA